MQHRIAKEALAVTRSFKEGRGSKDADKKKRTEQEISLQHRPSSPLRAPIASKESQIAYDKDGWKYKFNIAGEEGLAGKKMLDYSAQMQHKPS